FTSLAYVDSLAKRGGEWTQERRDRWNAAHNRVSAGERAALLDTWMLRSADGGVTWSAPYRVPVNSPHGPVALRDGRLLYAGKAIWKEGAHAGISFSSDDGASWTPLQKLPVRGGDSV